MDYSPTVFTDLRHGNIIGVQVISPPDKGIGQGGFSVPGIPTEKNTLILHPNPAGVQGEKPPLVKQGIERRVQ